MPHGVLLRGYLPHGVLLRGYLPPQRTLGVTSPVHPTAGTSWYLRVPSLCVPGGMVSVVRCPGACMPVSPSACMTVSPCACRLCPHQR